MSRSRKNSRRRNPNCPPKFEMSWLRKCFRGRQSIKSRSRRRLSVNFRLRLRLSAIAYRSLALKGSQLRLPVGTKAWRSRGRFRRGRVVDHPGNRPTFRRTVRRRGMPSCRNINCGGDGHALDSCRCRATSGGARLGHCQDREEETQICLFAQIFCEGTLKFPRFLPTRLALRPSLSPRLDRAPPPVSAGACGCGTSRRAPSGCGGRRPLLPAPRPLLSASRPGGVPRAWPDTARAAALPAPRPAACAIR